MPRILPENAQTPTSGMHVLLARFLLESDAFGYDGC
jgi:hypothetical protein